MNMTFKDYKAICSHEAALAEPPEPLILAECVHCGGEIVERQEVLDTGDGWLHPWCVKGYVRETLGWELIEAMTGLIYRAGEED